MTQRQLTRAFGMSLILSLLLIAPCWADVRADVAALMEHVRKHEVVDDSALRTAPPLELLAELRCYHADDDRGVRLEAIGQAFGVLHRYPTDAMLRQQVTGFLVFVATNDAEQSVAAYAADVPRTFSPHLLRADFTDAMRQDILNLVNQENPRAEFILLAGVAEGEAAKTRLQELSQKEGYEEVAQLALARMGVESSVEYVVKKFESFPVITTQDRLIKNSRLLRNLSYTRQPAAVEALIRYLFSDEKLPSEDMRYYPGTPQAVYALDLLAQIIEDFPIKSVGPSYSDAEIQTAREWIKAHRTELKIKR